MSNAVVNGVAGAGGGIIAQIITYPLQTVIRSEGWGGLYSGLKPSLFGTAASQVFKNKAEAIAAARKKKGLGDGTAGMFTWLFVAAIAGSLNVILTNPIWVLVTRMQTHTQAERKVMEGKREALLRDTSEGSLTDSSTLKDKLAEFDSIKAHPYGTLHAAREVYYEAGIKGFWKGIIPTLVMVCNPSIQFMIYESSLKHLRTKHATNKRGSKDVTALESRLQAKQEIGGNSALRYTGDDVELGTSDTIWEIE
ncbi:hypothetical protein HHK36_008877 [Tetracentron sinense]|uniref:Uncharacterized protein n=1 Tax=Tetracentron sinense TaxID=13715 RepID=A0A834ZJD8_TETSI|nr:hypothetical protein HHK36_008877 [Tetracentron sinense]